MTRNPLSPRKRQAPATSKRGVLSFWALPQISAGAARARHGLMQQADTCRRLEATHGGLAAPGNPSAQNFEGLWSHMQPSMALMPASWCWHRTWKGLRWSTVMRLQALCRHMTVDYLSPEQLQYQVCLMAFH